MLCRYSELSMPGTSWDDMSNIAVTHAATISRDVRYHLEAQSFLWDWICDGDLVQYTRNGRAFFEGTPHLGATAAAAAMAAVYAHSERNSQYLADDLAMTRGATAAAARCAGTFHERSPLRPVADALCGAVGCST